MEVYRPLRAALFFYDCVRLLAVLGMMLPVMPSAGEAGGISAPYLICAASNALFPLITLFVWLRFSVYRIYIELYMAGKSIVLAAALGWLLFSFRELPLTSLIHDQKGLLTLLGSGLLILADAGTIAGGLLLQNSLRSQRAVE